MVTCSSYQSLRHFRSVAEGHRQSGCEHQTIDHDSHEETKVAASQSLNINHSPSDPQKKIVLQHLTSMFINLTHLHFTIRPRNHLCEAKVLTIEDR
jgi:hypothetical protein